jgi:hypothetical protein
MRIDGGGSCEVFRGVIQRVDVAIKVLKQDQDKTTNGDAVSDSTLSLETKQFVAEMRLLQAVQHPNICRLLAVSMMDPIAGDVFFPIDSFCSTPLYTNTICRAFLLLWNTV